MEQRELTTEPRFEESNGQLQPRTRRKKGSKDNENRTSHKSSRSMPKFAKFLISLVLLAVSLVAGLIVGFSVVGNGSVSDALNFETYKHIYELVFKLG